MSFGAGEQTVLVVDIGGGTFDVTVLHCFEGLMEVRATAGDTWLGGEDFVDVLAGAFMTEVGEPAGVPPLSQLAPLHSNLRRQAELAKRRLSEAGEATIAVAYNGAQLSWTVDRAKFEQLSEGLLARVRVPIERALRDARLHPETISNVILAGGELILARHGQAGLERNSPGHPSLKSLSSNTLTNK